MKNLATKTWNSKNNNPLWKENLKRVVLYVNEDLHIESKLIADVPVIEINYDGNLLFSGSAKDLIHKLNHGHTF